MLNPLNSNLQAKLADFNNIPLELQQINQWLVWHYEDIGSSKPTKVPHSSVIDPATWLSFKTACEIVAHGKADGIGFVFTDDDPFCGLDLDDAKGDWLAIERQQKIYKEFDSYSEISPSGQGLHIIIKGKIPVGRKRSHIEIYSSKRYFTFTGKVYNNQPIADRQELLSMLFEQMGASIPQTMMFTGDKEEKETDEIIIQKASSAQNRDKFIQLSSGEWQTIYNSQSEADFAFVDIIAFYSRNKKQIARIFRNSKLGARDKAQRQDYVEYMIHRSFDKMLPDLDLDGLNIQIEKTLNKGPLLDYITAAPLPKHIQMPPGLLGEIAAFIYQASPRPVPEIALAGAIGLMAGICGRAYNVSDTGLNQYVLLLARTGRGKEIISGGINKLINAVRQQVPTVTEFIGPDEIASGPALYKFLSTTPCFVSVLSEFGLRLSQMADADGASPSTTLRKMYLQLYGKSGFDNVANASIYSDKDKNIQPIQSPSFSIIGESTPHTFYNNLTEEMILEGLLPRFLLIEYEGDRVSRNKNHAEAMPSFSLIEKLVTIAANAKTVMNSSPRRVIKCNFTKEAEKLADSFDIKCDGIINNRNNHEAIVELWNRAHLKVLKLAGLVAIGVNMFDPIIEEDHVKWALQLVENDIETLTKRFEGGDIGTNTAEIKQIELVIKTAKHYIMSDFEAIEKYLAKDEKAKMLKEHKVIPYAYLSRKLLTQAAFKNDKRGATEALKRCLQVMNDRDSFRELSKHEMSNRFGSTQRAFVVSDVNILK